MFEICYISEVVETKDQIKSVEDKLGYTLDTSYRNFLRFANGWKAFYQTVDLFGTNELLDSPIMKYAIEDDVIKDIDRFSSFNEYYLEMIDYNRDEIEDLKREHSSN